MHDLFHAIDECRDQALGQRKNRAEGEQACVLWHPIDAGPVRDDAFAALQDPHIPRIGLELIADPLYLLVERLVELEPELRNSGPAGLVLHESRGRPFSLPSRPGERPLRGQGFQETGYFVALRDVEGKRERGGQIVHGAVRDKHGQF